VYSLNNKCKIHLMCVNFFILFKVVKDNVWYVKFLYYIHIFIYLQIDAYLGVVEGDVVVMWRRSWARRKTKKNTIYEVKPVYSRCPWWWSLYVHVTPKKKNKLNWTEFTKKNCDNKKKRYIGGLSRVGFIILCVCMLCLWNILDFCFFQ